MKDSCWMIPKGPPCFIQLGRYGDIIQLLPAFKAIRDRIGENPVVMVSRDYANVLDGVSYVSKWEVPLPWWEGIPKARKMAEIQHPWVVVPQWWHEDKENFPPNVANGGVVLQCHGHDWGVDMAKWPDYGTSMWSRAGFSREEMMTLPLVFDRRDAKREETLARMLHATRPTVLVNWAGISSPYPFTPEFQRVMARYRDRFNILDIGGIRAQRIYDLLGLFDRAIGLVTIDTSTLHLAPASKIPYISFTRRDWSRSVPKGNCVLDIGYDEGTRRMAEFERVLQSWATSQVKLEAPFSTQRGGGVAVFK